MEKFRIPNKIKQPSRCCIYCGKNFIKKEKLDNHLTICELVHNCKKLSTLTTIEERKELMKPPSHEKMYEMILGLSERIIKLEEKLEDKTREMERYVGKQKKKINVLDWLNAHYPCNTTLETFLSNFIQIDDEDNVFLLENTYNDALNRILSKILYKKDGETIPPICAFSQKPNIFYVYTHEKAWKEMEKPQFKEFVLEIYLKISKSFCNWKNAKMAEIKKSDSFAIKCDKTMSKLMSVNYSDDSILSKTRGLIYQKMKIDIISFMGEPE